MRYRLLSSFIVGVTAIAGHLTSCRTPNNNPVIRPLGCIEKQKQLVNVHLPRKETPHKGKIGFLKYYFKDLGFEPEDQLMSFALVKAYRREKTRLSDRNLRRPERRGLLIDGSRIPQANSAHRRFGKNFNLPEARTTLRAKTIRCPQNMPDSEYRIEHYQKLLDQQFLNGLAKGNAQDVERAMIQYSEPSTPTHSEYNIAKPRTKNMDFAKPRTTIEVQNDAEFKRMCSLIRQIAKTKPSVIHSTMKTAGAVMTFGGLATKNNLCTILGAGLTACGYIHDCQKQWRDGLKEIQGKGHGGLKKRGFNDRLDHVHALPASPRERWSQQNYESRLPVRLPYGYKARSTADTGKQANPN